MKIFTKVTITQIIKYFLIIVVFITGVFLAKIFWNFPQSVVIWGFVIGASILIISLVADLISAKDILPIIKR